MTEDNRGPGGAAGEDDGVVPGREPERPEAAAPPETVTDREIPQGQPADDPEPEPGSAAGAAQGAAAEDAADEPERGDRLVAGGFAPPDSSYGPPDTSEDVLSRQGPAAGMGPQEVPLQDGTPSDMPQPPPPVQLGKPPADEDRPRPG
ncbi:hypothetical protein E1200_32955, partial [Actinomadura sp. GC306]